MLQTHLKSKPHNFCYGLHIRFFANGNFLTDRTALQPLWQVSAGKEGKLAAH